MDTYIVHSHGRVCSLQEENSIFVVPKNCFIISLCEYTEFLDDDYVTKSLIRFNQKKSIMIKLLKDNYNFMEEESYTNIKDLFINFIDSLKDESHQNPNNFCAYLPGYMFNNMSLLFRDKSGNFPPGIYSDLSKENRTRPDIVEHLKACNNETIHTRFIQEGNLPKVDLKTIVDKLCNQNCKKINLFFVIACNKIPKNKTEKDILNLTNKIQLINDNLDKIVKDILLQYYSLNPENICEMKDDHKEYLFGPQGGGAQKLYLIKLELKTKRRYILIKNRKWYLDENKNKYRYDVRFKNKMVIYLR